MQQQLFILTLLISVFVNLVFGEETPWEVPPDKEALTAPFMFDVNAQQAGEALYLKNCKSCHGDVGQANMIPLNPLPKDLAMAQVAEQKDGAMYYKIVNGRGAMPKFKDVLSVNDRWNVIAYIRSFHKAYKQAQPTKLNAFNGGNLALKLNWNAENNSIVITATGTKKEKVIAAEGIEIALYMKRYFGQLKLGESSFTNKDGKAFFAVDGKIPGDSIGVVQLMAKIVDADRYGEIMVEGEYKAGKPSNNPSLTEERAMWNIVSKAPWWITIAYPLAVLAVFGTMFYILILLRKIFILGKKEL